MFDFPYSHAPHLSFFVFVVARLLGCKEMPGSPTTPYLYDPSSWSRACLLQSPCPSECTERLLSHPWPNKTCQLIGSVRKIDEFLFWVSILLLRLVDMSTTNKTNQVK